jgi:hypothetical protein
LSLTRLDALFEVEDPDGEQVELGLFAPAEGC